MYHSFYVSCHAGPGPAKPYENKSGPSRVFNSLAHVFDPVDSTTGVNAESGEKGKFFIQFSFSSFHLSPSPRTKIVIIGDLLADSESTKRDGLLSALGAHTPAQNALLVVTTPNEDNNLGSQRFAQARLQGLESEGF